MDNRKIDALVAEHVLGWVDVAYSIGGYGDGRNNTEEGPWYEWRGRRERKEWVLSERIPAFTTRIDLAWHIRDVLCNWAAASDFLLAQDYEGCWRCYISWTNEGEARTGKSQNQMTAEMAICLAALQAFGVTP